MKYRSVCDSANTKAPEVIKLQTSRLGTNACKKISYPRRCEIGAAGIFIGCDIIEVGTGSRFITETAVNFFETTKS